MHRHRGHPDMKRAYLMNPPLWDTCALLQENSTAILGPKWCTQRVMAETIKIRGRPCGGVVIDPQTTLTRPYADRQLQHYSQHGYCVITLDKLLIKAIRNKGGQVMHLAHYSLVQRARR